MGIVDVPQYSDIAIGDGYSRLYPWYEYKDVHLVDLIVFFFLWGVYLHIVDLVFYNVHTASLVYPLGTHTIISASE